MANGPIKYSKSHKSIENHVFRLGAEVAREIGSGKRDPGASPPNRRKSAIIAAKAAARRRIKKKKK